MIKIIILSILGRQIASPKLIFSLVKTYLIIYMILLPGFMQAQEFEWLKTKSENYTLNPELLSYSVVNDNLNNVFWIGVTETIDYWNSTAYGNLFIHKYNATGDSLYLMECEGLASVIEAEVSSSGNLFLLVNIRDDLNVNGTPIPFTGTDTQSYLIKFLLDGTVDWYQSISEGPGFYSSTIALGDDGVIYVGTSDFTYSEVNLYSAEGIFQAEISQEGVQIISSIDVDSENNIYVTGSCANDGSSFNGVLMNPGFSYNVYLAKYDPQFSLEWVKFVEDVTCSFPQVVCNDPEHVYFTGDLYFSTLFDAIQVEGPQWVFDLFVARLNSNGNYMWVNEIPEQAVITGDAGTGGGSYCGIDDENNVYVSGFIRGDVNWGNDVLSSSTNMGYDLLALKYSPEGEIQYARTAGGELFDMAMAATSDNAGNYYLAGFGSENVAFGDHLAYEEGVYHVLTKISSGNVVSSVGTRPFKKNTQLSVFPNPVSDYISIGGDFTSDEILLVNLYNSMGNNVMQIEQPKSLKFLIGDFLPGIYVVEVLKRNTEKQSNKFLKSGH